MPLEDLARFNVSEEEILGGVYSPNFVRLMDFEARRARELYALAQGELAPEDRATLLTAEAMRLIDAALLERIINSNYRVLHLRHRLSAPHKLYLVGRAWAEGRISAIRG